MAAENGAEAFGLVGDRALLRPPCCALRSLSCGEIDERPVQDKRARSCQSSSGRLQLSSRARPKSGRQAGTPARAHAKAAPTRAIFVAFPPCSHALAPLDHPLSASLSPTSTTPAATASRPLGQPASNPTCTVAIILRMHLTRPELA